MSENFEIIGGKAIANGYGLIYQCENNEKIQKNLIKEYPSGWNRGSFIRIIENNSSSSTFFLEVLQQIIKNVFKDIINRIKQSSNQKIIMNKLIKYSVLPNTLANIYTKYYQRSLMTGITHIKNILKIQESMARERIKILRASNKVKQDASLIICNLLASAYYRNNLIKTTFAYEKILNNAEMLTKKHKKIVHLAKILKKNTLSAFLQNWWKKCKKHQLGCTKLINYIKHLKGKNIKEGFSALFCYSTHQKFKKSSRKKHLIDIFHIINWKKYRNYFNNWKGLLYKLKAEEEREFKNYML